MMCESDGAFDSDLVILVMDQLDEGSGLVTSPG